MAGVMVSRCVAIVGSDGGRPGLIREEVVLVRPISLHLFSRRKSLASWVCLYFLPWPSDLGTPDRLRFRARIAGAYRVGIVQRERDVGELSHGRLRLCGGSRA